MKNSIKKTVSVAVASVLAVSTIFSAMMAQAGSALDNDLVFAPMIDFEGLKTNINYDPTVDGMSENEYAQMMWDTDSGFYQVREGIGRNKSNGFLYKNKVGTKKEGVWSAIKFEPVYDEGILRPEILKYATIGAASDFCFWIDTTGWKTYKVIKDDNDEVIGREEGDPTLTTLSIWLAVYDDGTAAGESLSSYVPTKGQNFLIQDTENGGWIETDVKKDEHVTVPKGYKGYVILPRTAFHTIWGAHGDVIQSETEEQRGDNLFNGPLQFVLFEHLAGGVGLENAELVFDDFGFISYEEGFLDGIDVVDNLNEYFKPEKPEFEQGDVDGNGKVNTLDALIILKHIAKLEFLNADVLEIADYNKDGTINTLDSLDILKFVAKL